MERAGVERPLEIIAAERQCGSEKQGAHLADVLVKALSGDGRHLERVLVSEHRQVCDDRARVEGESAQLVTKESAEEVWIPVDARRRLERVCLGLRLLLLQWRRGSWGRGRGSSRDGGIAILLRLLVVAIRLRLPILLWVVPVRHHVYSSTPLLCSALPCADVLGGGACVRAQYV